MFVVHMTLATTFSCHFTSVKTEEDLIKKGQTKKSNHYDFSLVCILYPLLVYVKD